MIAVLGPGGVGGLVAAALARAGEDVVVVAREETAAALSRSEIAVESVALGSWVAHPPAVARLTTPVDVLVVATKATGLPVALERIEATPGLVVPLLNGVEHLAALRARFGEAAVCAGVIRVESDRPAPGRIVQTSPAVRIDLAPPTEAVRAFAAALEPTGIDVRVAESEPEVMWSKLCRLNALACTTSAYDLPLGAIRDDPGRAADLEAAVRETVAVARAEGAPLDPEATLAELAAAHPGLGSSMRRDIAAGRETEVEAIPGAVLRAAARHGLACPVVARLYAAINART